MLAGNEELAWGFKSIREDLIFWMNNEKIYANAMERNTIIGDKIQTWASNPLKTDQRKTNWFWWVLHLISGDSRVKLVSRHPNLTAVNWLCCGWRVSLFKTTARSNRLLRQQRPFVTPNIRDTKRTFRANGNVLSHNQVFSLTYCLLFIITILKWAIVSCTISSIRATVHSFHILIA